MADTTVGKPLAHTTGSIPIIKTRSRHTGQGTRGPARANSSAPALLSRKRSITIAPNQPATISDVQDTAARSITTLIPQHPIAMRAHARRQSTRAHSPQQSLSSIVLKNQAIDAALTAPRAHSRKPIQLPRQSTLHRRSSLVFGSLAMLLLGAYFTYLTMPQLSIRVAASQAGIEATYPGYRPNGYTLSGPIAYSDDQVRMKFVANAGPHSFTINQTKSSLDSLAVLENYVQPKAGNNYITNREDGLTIYTYDTSATWVDRGIMYTISGDAPLSNEQIRHIAVSM